MEQFQVGSDYRIPVDPAIYTLPALFRACYWLTDRCYVLITQEADRFQLHLSCKPNTETPLEQIAGEFANSLLDHQLRVELETETRGVRELIVAKAFAEGNLLEDTPPGDPQDPVAAGVDWNTMVGGATS